MTLKMRVQNALAVDLCASLRQRGFKTGLKLRR